MSEIEKLNKTKNCKMFLLFFAFVSLYYLISCGQQAFADNRTIVIPLGASNPHFETEAEFWFSPPVLTIHKGDTVTWLNSDKEIHTVSSGKGVDRSEFSQGKMAGTPDGYFESDSFKPGDSWSFTFDKSGTFYYFCTIHPWMNGAVVVSEKIPTFATDAEGNKIEKFPIVKYTQGREMESDLAWEPHVILTGEKITFIFQFYDPNTSAAMPPTNYHFTIVQNGTELFSSDGPTQFSGDYRYFVFKNSGPVEFKFEKIGGSDLSTSYSTIVFENPSEIKTEIPVIEPARNLLQSQEVILVLVGPPISILIFVVLWTKWGDKFRRKADKQSEKRSVT